MSEAVGEPLPWQRELDVAIADIDSRLKHPRRRVTDEQPTLPQLGQAEVTSEMIDEIAWRVAELLQREGGPVQGTTVAAAIAKTVSAGPPTPRAPVAPPPPEPRKLSRDIALSIRIRRPLFRWPFRRRYRKQAMITFSDYRIT